jgi:hypothetical protein
LTSVLPDGTPGPAGVDGLLLEAQRRLESLYALERQPPVTDFLIPEERAAALPGGGSRTLFAQDGDEVRLGIVLEGSVGDRLRRRDPRVALTGENLGAFCTLVEEVSHFVYLLFCATAERSVTQLELELQGEVDKYLSAVALLSLQNEGAVSTRLRALLFRSYRLHDDLTPERAERYRTASHLAYRYCGYLEANFLRRSRLAELTRESRRFYRLGQREKLERIAEIDS